MRPSGASDQREQAMEPTSAATRNPLSPQLPPPMPAYPGVPGPSPFPPLPVPEAEPPRDNNNHQQPPPVFHNISNSAGMTNPRSGGSDSSANGSHGKAVQSHKVSVTSFGRSPIDRPDSAGQATRGPILPLYPPPPDVGPIADLTHRDRDGAGAAPVSPTHATKRGSRGHGNGTDSPSRSSTGGANGGQQQQQQQYRGDAGAATRWSDEFGFGGALANRQEVLAGLPPPDDNKGDDGGGVRRLTLPAQTFDRWKNSGSEFRGDVPFQVNAKECAAFLSPMP